MEINWNFLGGGGGGGEWWGAKRKTFHAWGSMDIFWNCTFLFSMGCSFVNPKTVNTLI